MVSRHRPVALVIAALAATHLLVAPLGAQTAPAPSAAALTPTGLTVARLQYGGGGDWYVGPSSLPNLLAEVRERTRVPVALQPVTVRLTDAALWDHPFLFMSGHGNVLFTEEEVDALRRYLLAGGFLLANDTYGLDESFRREMRRVFPDKELVELPHDHPVFRAFYEMPAGIPKIHEHDNRPPQAFGLFHDGRLVAFYAYESDIADGWEDESVHGDPPEVREQAFRMGVNVFLYALSQRAR